MKFDTSSLLHQLNAEKEAMSAVRSFVLILFALTLSGCAEMGSSLFGGPPVPTMQPTAAQPAGEYRLGTGDVISVRVYGGEEEIRLERSRLDNSGIIALPFGEFKAGGSTAQQLEDAIMERVKGRILRNPRVWVSIDEYRPFFVDGQVSRPGAYPYQPGLNVRRAITIAGGFRERAALDKIFVFKEHGTSSQATKVDLSTPIGPGDTIMVQESFF